MSFHAARVAESPRLRRVLEFLRSRGADGATGWEIVDHCHVMNPGGAVSELRDDKNGCLILSYSEGKNVNGRKVWRYVLMREPQHNEGRTA